jgi:hypothetical protein
MWSVKGFLKIKRKVRLSTAPESVPVSNIQCNASAAATAGKPHIDPARRAVPKARGSGGSLGGIMAILTSTLAEAFAAYQVPRSTGSSGYPFCDP